MELIFLNKKFYNDYSQYKEIAKKELRPYILLVICYNNLDFGIPFRSNISHSLCIRTSNTTNAGIDFTKSVIIFDKKYIDKTKKLIIRENEYKQLIKKGYFIKSKFIKYIEKYKKSFEKIVKGTAHFRDIQLCKFSTLQNYHKEIGLDKKFEDYI